MHSIMYARGTQEAWVLNVTFGRIVIFDNNKAIYLEPVEDCIRFNDELCVIYDLIQAGLVEKVEE